MPQEELLSVERDRFTYLRGHTVDDGKIVPVSSVAQRNLENQRRIELERGQPMPHQIGDRRFSPRGFIRPFNRTQAKL